MLLILALATLCHVAHGSASSILERYEARLNSAIAAKQTGMAKTVKRYKCVEEYVTYDHSGKPIDTYQGTKFTTSAPPVYQKEIRRKPSRKITISMVNQPPTTTTPQKPIDELDDAEADRLIEEMYLKKKESHQVATTTTTARPEVQVVPAEQPIYSTKAYTPRRQSIVEDMDYEPYYPRRFHRRRQFVRRHYEDDYEDLPLFRPYKRDYRMRRRPRPLPYSIDETVAPGKLQTTQDLSPLRQISRLQPLPTAPPPPPSANAPAPLKMRPIAAAEDPSQFQEATTESCAKITKLATSFGIVDVSTWARGNCEFLKMYAPNATCQLIFHFIDSCKNKKLFN